MDPLKEFFESGQTILWIETQNTVAFLRPVPDILVWTPCPAAGLAQPLCFRQIRFVLPQRFFRPLPLLNIQTRSIPLDDIAALIPERHLAMEHPAVFPICPADASLVFEDLSRRKASEPPGNNSLNVLG